MSAGVDVYIEDGFAVIDFVDRTKRGPGIAALIESGGPGIIEKMTRSGPRALYKVPEGNAREAGLLDDAKDGAYPRGDLGAAQALADARTDGGRPVAPTSLNIHSQTLRAGEYRGEQFEKTLEVDQANVLGIAKVQTTLSDVPGESGLAPLHSEVIAATAGTVGHGPLDRDSARQAVPGTVPDLTLSAMQISEGTGVPNHGTEAPADGGWTELDASDAPRILVPDEDDEPTDKWTVADLQKYAKDHDIDLDGATRKADILAKVTK